MGNNLAILKMMPNKFKSTIHSLLSEVIRSFEFDSQMGQLSWSQELLLVLEGKWHFVMHLDLAGIYNNNNSYVYRYMHEVFYSAREANRSC